MATQTGGTPQQAAEKKSGIQHRRNAAERASQRRQTSLPEKKPRAHPQKQEANRNEKFCVVNGSQQPEQKLREARNKTPAAVANRIEIIPNAGKSRGHLDGFLAHCANRAVIGKNYFARKQAVVEKRENHRENAKAENSQRLFA